MSKIAKLLIISVFACTPHLRIVPKVAQDVQAEAPTQSEQSLSADEHDKILFYLNGLITEDSVAPIIAALQQADSQHYKEIWLKINTNGGSISAGFQLAQTIESVQAKTVCVVDIDAISMGFYLLGSCKERLMTKRAVLMVHQPLVDETRGNADELMNTVNALRAYTTSLINQSLSRMKISEKCFREHIANSKQWWMNYKEALEVGAIDGTIDVNRIPPVTTIIVKKSDDLDSLLKKLLQP